MTCASAEASSPAQPSVHACFGYYSSPHNGSDCKTRSAIQQRPGCEVKRVRPPSPATQWMASRLDCTKAARKIYLTTPAVSTFPNLVHLFPSRDSFSCTCTTSCALRVDTAIPAAKLPQARAGHSIQLSAHLCPQRRAKSKHPDYSPDHSVLTASKVRTCLSARSRARSLSQSLRSPAPATPCPVRRVIWGCPPPAALCDRARLSSLHSSPPTTKGRRSPALLVQPKRCRLLRFPHSSFSLTQLFPDSL